MVARPTPPAPALSGGSRWRLKVLGADALPAVRAGLASPDAVVAARSAAVLAHVRAETTRAFVAGAGEHLSPAWPRFKELAGDTPDSRRLFAAMAGDGRREREMEAAPAEAHSVYAAAMKRGQKATDDAIEPFVTRLAPPGAPAPAPAPAPDPDAAREALRRAVPAAEVAALLLMGAGLPPGGRTGPVDVRALFKAGFADGAEGEFSVPFRKLFAAWLGRQRDPDALHQGMQAALTCGLPEATPAARRVADDEDNSPALLATALHVIGHHGTKADLPLLTALRDDDRATERPIPFPDAYDIPDIHGNSDPAPAPDPLKPNETRVRDVVTAMALHLAGEDFEKYGFEAVELSGGYVFAGLEVFQCIAVSFGTEEVRTEAHKKAWAWLDARPKPNPAAP